MINIYRFNIYFKSDMQKIILKVTKESLSPLENGDVECFILSSSLSESFIQSFFEKANEVEKMVLLEGDGAVDSCVKLGLDGVLVDLSKSEDIKKDISAIKGKIGNSVLGVITRMRKHEAMIVSENEPDFVVFKVWEDGIENVKELVNWYYEFFILQSAIYLQEKVDIEGFSVDLLIVNEDMHKIFVEKI